MKYKISHLHIELSSLCNARCPQCPRNVYGYPYNAGYNEINLSYDTLTKILPLQTLSSVHNIVINGNFGDFVMNPESVEIVTYLSQNSKAWININTNGSARDRNFWSSLGKLQNIIIMFAIDGIGETNNLYRQDTNFDLIMRNAEIFIKAGGKAGWVTSIFEHNKHQISDMEKMSHQRGFVTFQTRETSRDIGPVYDRSGKKVFFMKDDFSWPDQLSDQYIEDNINMQLNGLHSPRQKAKIDCWALQNKSVYIAADGHVYPCCWVGSNPTQYRPPGGLTVENEETTGFVNNNHAPTVGLEKAMEWFSNLSATWPTDKPARTCVRICGK